jgi:hypothetical protein
MKDKLPPNDNNGGDFGIVDDCIRLRPSKLPHHAYLSTCTTSDQYSLPMRGRKNGHTRSRISHTMTSTAANNNLHSARHAVLWVYEAYD